MNHTPREQMSTASLKAVIAWNKRRAREAKKVGDDNSVMRLIANATDLQEIVESRENVEGYAWPPLEEVV